MNVKRHIACFLTVLICIAAGAVPARKGTVYLQQPDGSVFPAFVRGDEFTRIKMTASGHAVIQEDDGWWYYAIYGADGRKSSSGWRADREAPQEILASSRMIPYGQLAQNAQKARRSAPAMAEERFMKRMHGGIMTKGGNDGPVTKHGLVIPANFNNVKFQYDKSDFERMLTEQGYSLNGATGCAKEYFDDQFSGKIEFDFHVSDIVTLPRNRAYYGSNDNDGADKAPAEMVKDACRLADSKVDFSMFDDDKDGIVDNVFIFFAGADEAEGADEECIWSHAWYIYSGAGIDLELDGVRIDRYACSSELTTVYDDDGGVRYQISGIGTFCHEYSHTFGLPDFYDTDYEDGGGMSAGLWGSTSLMDGGNYNNEGNTPPAFNALERMLLGIAEPVILESTGTYSMAPINEEDGIIYMLPTDTEGEFFIFENRAATGWDRYIGGEGMLAYHVDKAERSESAWEYNEINISPSHQHADLLEADGRQDWFPSVNEYQDALAGINGLFFPYHDSNALTADTKPGLSFWNGNKSDCSVTSITKDGDIIHFTFLTNGEGDIPPTALNITKEVFADAAIIGFESSQMHTGEARIAWGRPGKEKEVISIPPYEPGKYAVILEGLEHSGKTYEIDIVFENGLIQGETRSTSVITGRMPSTEWPYIYLGSMKRNSDHTFPAGSRCPMRVYGATGAAEVRWKFNGKPVTHDGDGYYRLQESGILEAEIHWTDGNVDKVLKQITISQPEE